MVENESVDRLLPKVGHLAFSVYMVMKRYANKDTEKSFPSIDTISKLCRCSRTSAVKAVKTLEINKAIYVKRARKKPNVYTLNHSGAWGIDRHNLDGIVLRCPDCGASAVRKGVSFCCPKCTMDVGAYVEDVMRIHFPKVKKADIYGWDKKEIKNDYYGLPDSYYEKMLGVSIPDPVPDYQTKDIYIDLNA